MAQINVSNVSFCYEGSTERIFDQLSFSVDASWKIGFLGVNGKGKTTFLRLLRGEKEYEGNISSDVSFDYFPYHIEDTQRAYPFAEICRTLKPGVELWRLNVELEQLKLSPETLYRPFITLSQVEQTKVMLALLFS